MDNTSPYGREAIPFVWKLLAFALTAALIAKAWSGNSNGSFEWEPFVRPVLAEGKESATGAVEIESPRHDFGTRSQGEIVKHAFVVKNSGPGQLHILRVVAACGCTIGKTAKDVLKEGESTRVDVEFDTQGFSGKKEKVIRLYTSDPKNPVAVLSLTGEIQSDILLEPRQVFFEDLVPQADEKSRSQEVAIRVREGSGIEIVKVFESSPNIEIFQKSASQTEHHFVVRISPDAPLGEIRERVIIQLKRSPGATPGPSALNLPIFASIRGPLSSKPQSLAFGILAGDEIITKTVRVHNAGKLPIRIESVRSNHPAVSAEIRAIRDGKNYLIDVSVDPKKVNADIRTVIDLRTDSEEHPEFSISVYGVLPPKLGVVQN